VILCAFVRYLLARVETIMNEQRGRSKRAELWGGVGEVLLCNGSGLLLQWPLKLYMVPLLHIGVMMHDWGMFYQHRLESPAASRV
jgi:hypothetical protein